MKRAKVAVVTGDVTIDMNAAQKKRPESGNFTRNPDEPFDFKPTAGGAWLLADLIQQVGNKLNFKIRKPDSRDIQLNYESDCGIYKIYAIWSMHKMEDGEINNKHVWRINELWGSNEPKQRLDSKAKSKRPNVDDDVHDANLIVLDEKEFGFRDNRKLWPSALTKKGCHPLVLLRTKKPDSGSILWAHLIKHHKDRMIVVLTANDLRKIGIFISEGLSWEKTAEDLSSALMKNKNLEDLKRCLHVVIFFDHAGVLLLSNNLEQKQHTCKLFFDPKAIENMWPSEKLGSINGSTHCLIAAIARELMTSNDSDKLYQNEVDNGIYRGLHAVNLLYKVGYIFKKDAALKFPFKQLTKELVKKAVNKKSYGEINVDINNRASNLNILNILTNDNEEEMKKMAISIVSGVPEVLDKVPIAHFGKLVIVDRYEMEGLHSIKGLMKEHWIRHNRLPEKPLSIAVFGPPGSGKSFSIKQVAAQLEFGEVKDLTFNLSQFNNPQELLGAFHQVRDSRLRGKIPLVIWDEFDSPLNKEALGWLRYFLAPMQDGTFLEDQVTHSIGRSIFVFAGGTCQTITEFENNASELPNAKGPDFLSRLKGFVNICGPNRMDEADDCFMIRRAILLRAIFEDHTPQLIRKKDNKFKEMHIDPGVLNALLDNETEYKHGARSIESIVAMSRIDGRRKFEKSSLPSIEQLKLHIKKAEKFLELVLQDGQ